ncbi:MAG: hypothetical protein KIT80_16900 [Chitinophagaceae bacterium]|nr:hypothetical protein [Chitinophagaceae bacterium]MCW5928599.1 hypothetical protein [Chitinophagaceae bacterium]
MQRVKNDLYNKLIQHRIASTPVLNDNDIRIWGQQKNLVLQHYNSYLANCRTPNSFGPMEKHPYIDAYVNDFDPSRKFLLLGTFPPNSYFNNLGLTGLPNPNIQPNNPINYFYGNTADLWYYLFGLSEDQITIPVLQENLLNNNISISDVFAFVQRKVMNKANDSNYRNISVNCNLKMIFENDSKIETVLFTSGSLTSFLGNIPDTLIGFRWILEECLGGLNNFRITGDLEGVGPYFPLTVQGITNSVKQQRDGIVWWIKLGDKRIRMINLPTPSPLAALNIPGSPFYLKWVKYMAATNNLPLPSDTQINSLNRLYLPLYPTTFSEPYTKHYRQEVYSMALNNTLHLI